MFPIPIPKSHLAASLSLQDEVIRWSINMRVRVLQGSARGCLATVKACVMVDGILWIGLALDEPLGKNNGCTSSGERHFHCAPNHGLYVCADKGYLEAAHASAEAVDATQVFANRMSASLREDVTEEPEMIVEERRIGRQPATPQANLARVQWGTVGSDTPKSGHYKNRWMSNKDVDVNDWRKARLQELYAQRQSPC